MDFLHFVDSRKREMSFEELQLELGGLRECETPELPRTTLIYWLQKLKLPIQKDGYTDFHRKKLGAFALYLRSREAKGKRGTIKGFKAFWNEYQTYQREQNEPRQSDRTVAVNSQPVC